MKLALAVALAACHDPGPVADAPPCVPFTGEYVDWDSSEVAFCGIFDARWTIRGVGATDQTSPNGRFELCLPAGAPSIIDVTPPTQPSQCTSGSYAAAGIAVIDPASPATFSARSYTTARRDAVFGAAGLTYDPAKAQVFVHTTTAVTVPGTHDPAIALATGGDVLVPNVTVPANGHVTVTAGATTIDVPVAADTLSYTSP